MGTSGHTNEDSSSDDTDMHKIIEGMESARKMFGLDKVDEFMVEQFSEAKHSFSVQIEQLTELGPTAYLLSNMAPEAYLKDATAFGHKVDQFVANKATDVGNFFVEGFSEVSKRLKGEYQQLKDLGILGYIGQNGKTVINVAWSSISDFFSRDSDYKSRFSWDKGFYMETPQERVEKEKCAKELWKKIKEMTDAVFDMEKNMKSTDNVNVKHFQIEGENESWDYTEVDGKIHGIAVHHNENGVIDTKFFYHGAEIDMAYFDNKVEFSYRDGSIEKLKVSVNGQSFGVNITTIDGKQHVVVEKDAAFEQSMAKVKEVLSKSSAEMTPASGSNLVQDMSENTRNNRETLKQDIIAIKGNLPNPLEATARNMRIIIAQNTPNRISTDNAHIEIADREKIVVPNTRDRGR